jgi:nucleotide-binding universal stress UspA family protein
MRAAKKALEMHKRDKSEIVVFHSVIHKLMDLRPTLESGPGMTLSYKIYQNQIDSANKVLNQVKAIFDEADAPIETRLINYKEPHDYIKERVKEEGFDLVILGCKGEHSKLEKIIGTVPEKVLEDTPCDVLIVR